MSASGKLRHWLLFERLSVDQDSDGATVEAWVDAFEVNPRMPCEIENLSGSELLAAQALASHCTHRLSVRYRPGFAADQRATHSNGTIYNIQAVVPDDVSGIRWLRLLCSTGLSAGGTAT